MCGGDNSLHYSFRAITITNRIAPFQLAGELGFMDSASCLAGPTVAVVPITPTKSFLPECPSQVKAFGTITRNDELLSTLDMCARRHTI
mmetsp:Transcript_6663/g.11638  ORF Transcript_6663/g.11638 Transcript_6663/m.11638 type:complete len:89 (+) Transcript_6663:842-1108(+)